MDAVFTTLFFVGGIALVACLILAIVIEDPLRPKEDNEDDNA